MFHHTYALLCFDGKLYIGYTDNLMRRLKEHKSGKVHTTLRRLPVELVYYEACLTKTKAMERERYFKTGYGRGFLSKRLDLPT